MITPNASFMGHLGGILAGFVYEHLLLLVLPKELGGTARPLFGRDSGGGGGVHINNPYRPAGTSFGQGFAR
jgi:hypothetical protein